MFKEFKKKYNIPVTNESKQIRYCMNCQPKFEESIDDKIFRRIILTTICTFLICVVLPVLLITGLAGLFEKTNQTCD